MGSTWSWPPQQSLLYLYCNSGFLGNRLWSIDLCAGNSLGGAVRVNTCGQAKANRQVEREAVGTLADFMRRQLRGSGAGWPCRVSHPEARRVVLYTCALTCHWMSTELDKWALFNWWQCSERVKGELSAVNIPGICRIIYFGPGEGGGDILQHPLHILEKTKLQVFFSLLFLAFHPCLWSWHCLFCLLQPLLPGQALNLWI